MMRALALAAVYLSALGCACPAPRDVPRATVTRHRGGAPGHSATSPTIRIEKRPRQNGSKSLLFVTLENPIAADELIWANSRMAEARDGRGDIEALVLNEEGKDLRGICSGNVERVEAWDYIVLAPGSSVTRAIDLECFNLPREGRVSVQIIYHDVGADAAPPSPLPNARLLSEELRSNTIYLTGAQ